jgi:hypothetical protein
MAAAASKELIEQALLQGSLRHIPEWDPQLALRCMIALLKANKQIRNDSGWPVRLVGNYHACLAKMGENILKGHTIAGQPHLLLQLHGALVEMKAVEKIDSHNLQDIILGLYYVRGSKKVSVYYEESDYMKGRFNDGMTLYNLVVPIAKNEPLRMWCIGTTSPSSVIFGTAFDGKVNDQVTLYAWIVDNLEVLDSIQKGSRKIDVTKSIATMKAKAPLYWELPAIKTWFTKQADLLQRTSSTL